MPIYLFEHPKTGHVKEIFLPINGAIQYIDDENIKWQRLYTVPTIGIDTKIDPYSKKAFLNKTQKAGTVGDLFDLSKELSEKRGGSKNDPVKKDYTKEWKKKRNKK
jgi:hypothetical protein